MNGGNNTREEALDALYRKTAEVAKRYYFAFRRPRVTVGGLPIYLFLGNHSSGKSTLINSVLEEKSVQDVGIAPTDDGFTFLVYGEEERDVVGAAALTLLPMEYRDLENYGGAFLQHLKVKVRKSPILKEVTLIDSPGMIDSSDTTRDRDYDFKGVVRRLSELCDMIFFLFDPEKPGTTGETVRIFSECLKDVQFKLRVILNKCDLFANVYDFARAYGTLCWNLSRVLKTKDLPKILTVCSTESRPGTNAKLVEEIGVNRHRQELQELFSASADRRNDNLFAQASDDFRGLTIRMGVVNAAARKIGYLKFAYWLFAFLIVAGVGMQVKTFAEANAYSALVRWVMISAVSTVALAASWFLRLPMMMLSRFVISNRVEDLFRKVFRAQLATKVHDDVVNAWTAQQTETSEIIRSAPLDLPLFAEWRRRGIERSLARLLDKGEIS